MRKPKANITLASAADSRGSNLWFMLRKGLCELRRPGTQTVSPTPIPRRKYEKKLSLIICTAGTCPGLGEAIRSALSQTMNRGEYEVLVVWNREDEPPRKEFPGEIRWIQEPTPGISHARNAGAGAARGEILLYMDDDAVSDKDLVRRMVETFRDYPDTAIVGGQIFLKVPKPRPEAFLVGRESLWSGYRVPYKRFRQVKESYAFPYGACFGIGKDALMELGGFPMNYGRVREDFGGGEETAVCFLALQRGWKIGIQPKAWVEHRVEPRRFNREHIRKTIRAGILTTYRLYREGYAQKGWDLRYVKERLEIAEQELTRLRSTGTSWEEYYKKCERDAFLELVQEMERELG